MGGPASVGALVMLDDGYLAERRAAIREGWVPGECELCGADGETIYLMFADEPLEEPLDVFACRHCAADPPS